MLDVWVLCKLYKKKQPPTTAKLTRKKGNMISSTSENEKENAIKVDDQDQRLEGQEIYFVTEELSSSSSEELSSSSTSENDVFFVENSIGISS